MEETSMAVPRAVRDLVERFGANRAEYRDPRYNEASLRVDFVNPFFEALGWDVRNRQRLPEDQRDVRVEDRVRVAGQGGGRKAPDYGFYIGGTRKFFVETKKPA